MNDLKIIFETDYNRFKTIPGNREVDQKNVQQIVESIRKIGAKNVPVLVDKNWFVGDGQHRIEAYKLLNLPVPVQYDANVKYTLKDVQTLNSHFKSWNTKDYLISYGQNTKNKNYIELQKFMDTYGFPIGVSCSILANQTQVSKEDYENGNFVVLDIKEAYKTADKIIAYKPYFKGYKMAFFVRTLLSLFNNPEFDNDRMIHKLSLRPGELVTCDSQTSYKICLQKIYNYKCTESQKKVFVVL